MDTRNVIDALEVGDKIKVLPGATAWMKKWNYWLDDMGDNIDGLDGEIVADYTDLQGRDAHYGTTLESIDMDVGISPRWLQKI